MTFCACCLLQPGAVAAMSPRDLFRAACLLGDVFPSEWPPPGRRSQQPPPSHRKFRKALAKVGQAVVGLTGWACMVGDALLWPPSRHSVPSCGAVSSPADGAAMYCLRACAAQALLGRHSEGRIAAGAMVSHPFGWHLFTYCTATSGD
jgi:hypothetical protein